MGYSFRKVVWPAAAVVAAAVLVWARPGKPEPSPNGIEMPAEFRDWRFISASLRSDNDTMRAVLGNAAAVKAARTGRTRPWPDGAILAKLVWKRGTHEAWPTASVPGAFVHAEFMVKDAAKYADTGGWGFARWLGPEHKPYGKDAGFAKECFACHLPVKDSDYVFTRPAALP